MARRRPVFLSVIWWLPVEGTYLITGFKSGGGYHSKLVDRETTTYNHRGSYAQPPHSYNNSSGNNYSGNQATTNQSTNQLTGNNIAGTMSEAD